MNYIPSLLSELLNYKLVFNLKSGKVGGSSQIRREGYPSQ
jgi:hypothetical protein